MTVSPARKRLRIERCVLDAWGELALSPAITRIRACVEYDGPRRRYQAAQDRYYSLLYAGRSEDSPEVREALRAIPEIGDAPGGWDEFSLLPVPVRDALAGLVYIIDRHYRAAIDARNAAAESVDIEEGPRHRPGDRIACQQADALYLRLRALAREIGPATPDALLAEYRRGSALPSQLSEREALRIAADAQDAWEMEASR